MLQVTIKQCVNNMRDTEMQCLYKEYLK